jgi:predicted NAD/FAD-binding protein
LGRKALDKLLDVAWGGLGMSTDLIYRFVMAPMEALSRRLMPVHGFPKNEDGSPTRVAIIGGGCSGLSAAWTLHRTEGFEFTIYESAPMVGGHSFTYNYTGEDGNTAAIDMGFIFGHHRSYLNMLQLMAHTDTKVVDTELSLNVDIKGKTFATDANLCGATEDPVMEPGLLAECERFHALAERMVENSAFNIVPFGLVLAQYGFTEDWKELVMTPTLITLFISPNGLYTMSARFMFNMFAGKNKFVDLRSAWKVLTVHNGTFSLWAKICSEFEDRVRVSTPVRELHRLTGGNGQNHVMVVTDGDRHVYDHVLIACGAKVANSIVQDKSYLEKFVLGSFEYEGERVVLHTDSSFLPEKNLRNFNYKVRDGFNEPELTGVMTQASGQEVPHPMPMLTMNPMREPKEGSIKKERFCAVHQQGWQWLIFTRTLLPSIQGNGNVWYCGSWCNFMGHSGGIDAGMAAACRIGGRYQLSNEVYIKDYFAVCCQDMFGPRFDWRNSPRRQAPILKARL